MSKCWNFQINPHHSITFTETCALKPHSSIQNLFACQPQLKLIFSDGILYFLMCEMLLKSTAQTTKKGHLEAKKSYIENVYTKLFYLQNISFHSDEHYKPAQAGLFLCSNLFSSQKILNNSESPENTRKILVKHSKHCILC